MHIVTDGGADLNLSAEECAALGIHIVPLSVTLDGQTYRGAADISLEAFYDLLVTSGSFPTTSQPSVGDFAALYRRLAEQDPEILSIHMSSGLSGTLQAARAAAQLAPEARITYVDTKTLSAATGWQVEAAARAIQAGWSKDTILALVAQIGAVTDSVYTLDDLKFLIHGGRISHMKGLIASVLNIKPLIGVEKVRGTYVNLAQARSFSNAIKSAGELVSRKMASGMRLRAQVVHAANPDGAQQLADEIAARFKVDWVPVRQLSLVLGAHVGRSMVGVCFAPAGEFESLP